MTTTSASDAADEQAPEPSPRGRPRDAARDEAIRTATLELVAELGYDRLTMELVAARAKAGKATIYRRWPSKAELVTDALLLVKPAVASIDTGTLEGDMQALMDAACSKRGAFATAVMGGIASSLGRDPELLAAFRERVTQPRIERIRSVLARAQERGELSADVDVEFVATIVPSLVLQRTMMTGATVEREYVGEIFQKALRPMLGLAAPTTTRTSDQ